MPMKRAHDVVPRCEERRGSHCVEQAPGAQMPRAIALGGKQHSARDNCKRADEQWGPYRLPEEDECDRNGGEWRSADGNRCPRRADLAYPEREEHLRRTGREQPGEKERPEVMHVVPKRRRNERDAERSEHRRE